MLSSAYFCAADLTGNVEVSGFVGSTVAPGHCCCLYVNQSGWSVLFQGSPIPEPCCRGWCPFSHEKTVRPVTGGSSPTAWFVLGTSLKTNGWTAVRVTVEGHSCVRDQMDAGSSWASLPGGMAVVGRIRPVCTQRSANSYPGSRKWPSWNENDWALGISAHGPFALQQQKAVASGLWLMEIYFDIGHWQKILM